MPTARWSPPASSTSTPTTTDRPRGTPACSRRRDTVARRRLQAGVPRGLSVVVGVDVDEAGGDQRAVGIDRSIGALVDLADGDHLSTVDAYVGGASRSTGSIDQRATADD